jgi:hypothetical protein
VGITNVWQLPFGPGRRWLSDGGVVSYIAGGWQVNNMISIFSGPPFSVFADGTSLNLPGSNQTADQVKPVVKLGGVGSGTPYYDPTSFADVNEARFGFNRMSLKLFFVDLHNQIEREAIWEIQVSKYSRDPKDFDIIQLARATDGLTGSEIEAVFTEALHIGFDQEKEPTDLDIAQVLTEFVPLSKLMSEQIHGIRSWAKGRARLATSGVVESRIRKLGV